MRGNSMPGEKRRKTRKNRGLEGRLREVNVIQIMNPGFSPAWRGGRGAHERREVWGGEGSVGEVGASVYIPNTTKRCHGKDGETDFVDTHYSPR